MAADWNLAQVLVGVFAIIATYSLTRRSAGIALAIRKLIRPYDFRCERLEWSDIPEGLLHQCSIPKEHCEHIIPAQKDTTEWEPLICTYFQLIRRGNFSPKPTALDLGVRYVRTDQRVLKTLLGLTANTQEFGDSNERRALVFEEVKSVMTAYFKPLKRLNSYPYTGFRREVTKTEAAKILNGYPPWYCETLLLVNGDRITHPIKCDDDIRRGGWIVAIGLSNTLPVARDFMLRADHNTEFLSLGRACITVNKALTRVLQCLSSAAEAFPREPAVEQAQKLLEAWISIFSVSEVFSTWMSSPLCHIFKDEKGHHVNRWVQDAKRQYASVLSTYQCQMALQAFSHPGPFSAEEEDALGPVILVVIRAVMVGCFAVLDYLESRSENDGVKKMWEELDGTEGPIYLREWKDGDWT